MPGLNPQQARAVNAVGHCVVLACPGSGKTRVLSMRAASLLSGHPEGRLCAVTFTRDAAQELKTRILDQCGRYHARRIAVGTFHSIAYAQLKRSGRQGNTRILSDSERLALLRRCRDASGAKIALDALARLIDAAKATLAEADLPPPADAVYELYQEALLRDGAMDFFDIMLRALRLMREGALRPLPVRWLLVDEAQDMDEVQMLWVLEHAKRGVEITLVGDDDQSLYGFRHALGHAGLKQVQTSLSASVIQLPINYRCATAILSHAARLIAHNADRAPKDIRPHRQDEGEIGLTRYSTRWAEARAMSREAARVEGTWAILARTNAILDHAEAALALSNVKYTRLGGGSLWDGRAGAVFLGLLRAIDDGGWMGIANALHACGIDARPLADATEYDPYGALDAVVRDIPEDKRHVINSLRDSLPQWMEQAKRGRATLVVHAAAAWLARNIPGSMLDTLGLLETCFAGMSGTLAQRLALASRNQRQRQQTHRISIMTLHASKGLEFDNVWILGCEEGVLPHAEGSTEEERRLMYVGITRARHRLHISHVTGAAPPSRFIREAEIHAHQRT